MLALPPAALRGALDVTFLETGAFTAGNIALVSSTLNKLCYIVSDFNEKISIFYESWVKTPDFKA